MLPVHREFYDNSPGQAAATLETYLDSSSWGEDDAGLLKLELASALQANGQYARAARLLAEVDQKLEVLDYSQMPLEDIASFLFATNKPWRATPPERLMVNTQGMVNRLVQHDNPDALSEAAVEASRLRTLLTQGDLSEEELFGNDFANALAGFCMEQRGRLGEAEDFWREVKGAFSLRPTDQQELDADESGTVLVIVQMGKAPIRRQYRLALPVDGNIYQLRIPVMVERSDAYRTATVFVDGVAYGEVPLMFDYGKHLMTQYKRDRGRLLAAAAAQLISRTFIARSMGEAANRNSESRDAGKFTEFFAHLFLAEMQPPDTRCWSLTPQSFHALRLDLPAGEYQIGVVLDGTQRENLVPMRVSVQPRQPVVLNVVSDRFRTWNEKEGLNDLTPKDASAAQVALWDDAGEAEKQLRMALQTTN